MSKRVEILSGCFSGRYGTATPGKHGGWLVYLDGDDQPMWYLTAELREVHIATKNSESD